MKENLSKLMVKMFPRIGSGWGQLERQLPTPLRISWIPGEEQAFCEIGKGGVFSRAGWDHQKTAYSNPCKAKNI